MTKVLKLRFLGFFDDIIANIDLDIFSLSILRLDRLN